MTCTPNIDINYGRGEGFIYDMVYHFSVFCPTYPHGLFFWLHDLSLVLIFIAPLVFLKCFHRFHRFMTFISSVFHRLWSTSSSHPGYGVYLFFNNYSLFRIYYFSKNGLMNIFSIFFFHFIFFFHLYNDNEGLGPL